MADVLSEDQINEIQEAFTKVDTDTDGVISTADLGQCLRLLGQNPTIAEIQASLLFRTLNIGNISIFTPKSGESRKSFPI